MDGLIEGLKALSGWEILATLLGILYLLLVIRESFWAWPSAFFSTLIYTLLFWEGQLPLQSVLNAFYLVMAVYGFWLWHKSAGQGKSDDSVSIHTKPLLFHLVFIGAGGLITMLLGYYLTASDTSRAPYLDAGVMVFSVMNTWLVARKVLENWDYWLVINTAAIWLYWQTEFYVTTLLMVIYFFMVLVGRFRWRQSLYQQQVVS